MPTLVHIENRYCSNDYVSGATVTFDDDPITAQSPRTGLNGNTYIDTKLLADGRHVLRVRPLHTSEEEVGPRVAEDLPYDTKRMFRSLDVDFSTSKGKITTVSVPAGKQMNGTAGAGTNPVYVFLQPIFFRGGLAEPKGARKHENISLIVIHQTAGGGKVHGTLSKMLAGQGTASYLVTHDPQPQTIKIMRDKHVAGHVALAPKDSWWGGKSGVESFSIGIENNHMKLTPWPRAQIEELIRLLERLLKAYPSLPRSAIVGHSDVFLQHRDCPGREFDWPLLEKEGLGMIPRTGVSLDQAFGGFFRLRPQGMLQAGDTDAGRRFGGSKEVWPAAPAPGTPGPSPDTVLGQPIRELQTDLRAIGYGVQITGIYDSQTLFAVEVFQKHFFAGARRTLTPDRSSGSAVVDRITAEYIKAVRP